MSRQHIPQWGMLSVRHPVSSTAAPEAAAPAKAAAPARGAAADEQVSRVEALPQSAAAHADTPHIHRASLFGASSTGELS